MKYLLHIYCCSFPKPGTPVLHLVNVNLIPAGNAQYTVYSCCLFLQTSSWQTVWLSLVYFLSVFLSVCLSVVLCAYLSVCQIMYYVLVLTVLTVPPGLSDKERRLLDSGFQELQDGIQGDCAFTLQEVSSFSVQVKHIAPVSLLLISHLLAPYPTSAPGGEWHLQFWDISRPGQHQLLRACLLCSHSQGRRPAGDHPKMLFALFPHDLANSHISINAH